MKQVYHKFLRKQALIKKLLRPLILLFVVANAIVLVTLLSHATWFPGLLQVVANNLDSYRYYQPTDQEYLEMLLSPTYCTKSEDCQIACQPSPNTTDCNSYSYNTYSDQPRGCTEIGCRANLFTYASCQNNQCVIRGF